MNKVLSLLLLTFVIAMAFAQLTPEGTVICNHAYASYTGSRGLHTYEAWSDTACITVAFDAGIMITPSNLMTTGYLENPVFFAHRVFNLGNGPDTIDIAAINEHGWDVLIRRDVNFNGIVDPEDVIYNPDVIEVAQDDSIGIIVEVLLGDDDAYWGVFSETEVIATSRRNPSISDNAFDTVLVVGPRITLVLEADPLAPSMVGARDVIDYTLHAINSDADTARQAVDITFSFARHDDINIIDSPIPEAGWLVEYFSAGSWAGAFVEDADSVRFRLPDTDTLAVGDSVAFRWQGEVLDCPDDASISAAVVALYFDTTMVHEYYVYSDTVQTDVNSPSVSIEADAVLYGNIADTIIYEMTIENLGDVSDQYLIILIEGAWGYHPIYNTDCDGILTPGEMAEEDTITGTILPGASSCITILVEVPDTHVTTDDTVLVIVRSTENFCVEDTVQLVFSQIIPRLVVNKDIIDEFGDYSNTDDTVIPGDTIEYAIKFWNVQMGLADNIIIYDTISYFTPLVEGIPESEFKHQLPDDANTNADWLVEYSLDGVIYTPYDFTTPGIIANPEGSGDPVILRISEVGPERVQPAVSPPAPGEEDTTPGQGEFRFRVILR